MPCAEFREIFRSGKIGFTLCWLKSSNRLATCTTKIPFFRMSGFWFFNYFRFNCHNYLIFNVLNIFLYIFDIEIHTNVFMRHKTPLNQVRFKKILPWFAFEPSFVQRERNYVGTPTKALFYASKLGSRGVYAACCKKTLNKAFKIVFSWLICN